MTGRVLPTGARAMRASPGAIAALMILLIGGAAALFTDPARDTSGHKGDEATFVAMALSLAHDGDFRFDGRDLRRFWATYAAGPEGIFLRKGAPLRPELHRRWPFVTLEPLPERAAERLYYGKAFIYGLLAAPFAWVAGVNGLFFFNVVLFALMVWAGYTFLAARGTPAASLLFVTAFLGAACTWWYGVWLTPEILNVALVFLAYFLWLHKEVATTATHSLISKVLMSPASDLVAAALLGLATYSKPPNILLVLPILFWHVWRGQWRRSVVVGTCFAAFLAGGFALTGIVTGDPNYQGGERRSFYGSFPFETRQSTFDNTGVAMATDAFSANESFEGTVFWSRLQANALYFVVGRHFGFLPYFFPGVVALAAFLRRARTRPAWTWVVLAATGVTAVWFLINTPFSWSGGGGPVGNRYFLSVYPVLFFVVPPLRSVAPGVIAWLGGAAFVAHILVQPLYAAKNPWVVTQRGLLQWLPVELTMPDDLPVRLNLARARLNYGEPRKLLYLINDYAFNPEPGGLWVAGDATAEILVRSDHYGDVRVRLESPIANTVTLDAGGRAETVTLEPGVPVFVTLPVRWVQARLGSAAFLLTIRTTDGFVPRLRDPSSPDSRFLGAQINFEIGRHFNGSASR